MSSAPRYILWFNEVDKDDIGLVGGKGANLGEMVSFGVSVPPGFIVTSAAYFYFLEENNLQPKIREILKKIDQEDPHSFSEVSEKIRNLIMKGRIPKDLALAMMKAYLKLGYPREVFVAVRSSATAEDLPQASFAGQQASFLNVKGEANVVKKVQECWASLFTARAIFYREQNKFDHLKIGMAVPVQRMVQAETSGVMFTIDPIRGQKNQILIEAIYGLGELIVQGATIPDRYLVNKNTLEIITKEIATQAVQLMKVSSFNKQSLLFYNKESRVPKQKQDKQKLSNKQIVALAQIGKKIHQHYFFPQDIEWAVEKGKIYILQTRPVTALQKTEDRGQRAEKEELEQRKPILTGVPASPGVAVGPVKIVHSPKEIEKVKKGEILVTGMTTPDFVPAMKKVVAIITDKGGQTSHAAIVSRELGIPCVVGTKEATKVFKNGEILTVNGKTGEIYKGGLISDKQYLISNHAKIDKELESLQNVSHITSHVSPLKTATKLYVNLAEPELAAEIAQKDVDGVGLLRAEFMMAEIGVHPKKLIHDRKQKVFISKLTENLSIFCEQFKGKPIIYRATDFKTNEYRNLLGGQAYEPEEANPMLGYRGAYRYLSDPVVFELELEAVKKVRGKFKNLQLMIPFIHAPWELFEVKKIVAASGLLRSPTFKLLMMVEIPSNIISLEDFIKIGIDGVSIGSNDLTMLILGVDRDNNEVANLFNELDPAVLWALERVIKTCHQFKITSSICGQAPSLYPDLVEKLVEWGITSISVNPDAIEETRRIVYEAEKRLVTQRARR